MRAAVKVVDQRKGAYQDDQEYEECHAVAAPDVGRARAVRALLVLPCHAACARRRVINPGRGACLADVDGAAACGATWHEAAIAWRKGAPYGATA